MLNTNDQLPENPSLRKDRTIEKAREYENKRFGGGRRMKRLNELEKQFAQKLFQMVGSDSHIVDIPCGNGRFFEYFSSAKKLTMIDRSVNMLQAAEEKIGTHENVSLLQADITDLPLEDNSADLCFCIRLFHHMEGDQIRLSALQELARISKKFVALSFYNRNRLRYYRKKLLGKKIHGHYITLNHLADLAGQAGLELVEQYPKYDFIEQQCLVIFKKI